MAAFSFTFFMRRITKPMRRLGGANLSHIFEIHDGAAMKVN